jgi:SAM-dependent methyltransferase
MMFSMPDASAFDEFYYRNCCGQRYERSETWLTFFGTIADRIVRDINPKRVLDAGCAIGMLVEALRERGVDARGIDVSSYAIQSVPEALRPYVREGSIAQPFGERFDLIVCIEVLEHMPAGEADLAIANLAAHTDDVLFSSTPFDYREPTHVNVRMPEEWAEAFARYGFYRDVDFDASFVTKWAARFIRRSAPVHRIIRDYERRFWQARAAELDARSYAMELQQRLQAVEEERDRLAPFEPEVHDLRILRGDLEEQANLTRQRLQGAENAIAAMESSWFWKARMLTVRLRRVLFGSSTSRVD